MRRGLGHHQARRTTGLVVAGVDLEQGYERAPHAWGGASNVGLKKGDIVSILNLMGAPGVVNFPLGGPGALG